MVMKKKQGIQVGEKKLRNKIQMVNNPENVSIRTYK